MNKQYSRPVIILSFLLIYLLFTDAYAQNKPPKDAFAHTFSIVARDANTGEMAVGVQSHWFSVGTLVAWGKSGVGVVATQSFVNVALGPDGLALMEEGMDAKNALKKLISQDEGRDFRQAAFLDVTGNVDAHTGKNCVDYAHHHIGNNYSVQANMMLNDKVAPAIAQSFEKNKHLPLAERVVEALQAGQDAGGDIRGKQSAALIVVGPKPAKKSWEDKKIDLRVDDHSMPIQELSRLLKVHRAYEHMNKGDLAIEHENMEEALKEYQAAANMFPENLEMKYWKAVTLANNNRLQEAMPIFKKIFKKDKNWREMTKRLPKAGLLVISESELERILAL